MISICLPSRGRSNSFLQMCKSALDLAYCKDDIEIVVRRDSGDRSSYVYIGNHKVVTKPRTLEVFQMWNECQQAATGPIYMYMSDDFVFTTKDWDREVTEEFDKSADKIVLLAAHNGDEIWKKYQFSGLGFVHKNWVDAIGYLFPNYFYPNNADKWVNDISMMIGRRIRLKMTCLNVDQKDNVHARKSQLTRHWRGTYYTDMAVQLRIQDSEKLKAVMLPEIDQERHWCGF